MFKRMILRSLPKVNVEFGLVALAHNIKKIAKMIEKNDLTGKKLSLLDIFTSFLGVFASFGRVESYSAKIAA